MSNENATSSSQINNVSKMEGWLYLIRCNRFGLQFSRKRYFLLDNHLLRSFKSVPDSNDQVHFFVIQSFSLKWNLQLLLN
jgi:hypothetical protein